VNTVRCAACGAENPGGSIYCAKCARKLDEETRTEVERQRTEALESQPTGIRWVTVLITLLVLAVLAAVLVGVLIIR